MHAAASRLATSSLDILGMFSAIKALHHVHGGLPTTSHGLSARRRALHLCLSSASKKLYFTPCSSSIKSNVEPADRLGKPDTRFISSLVTLGGL